MPKIIIQEVEQDDLAVQDIWATIEMQSEKTGLMVQFQLEALMFNWDSNRVEGDSRYLEAFKRWVEMADRNGFDFQSEPQFIPPH